MLRWLGLALLGILVAAAISVAASRLASQQIGLASQPVSAGDALAPKAERNAGEHKRAPSPSHPVETPLGEEGEPGGPDD